MTITCPKEFNDAVQHALCADSALAAEIARRGDTPPEHEHEQGQAVRTLLTCFGYRANSDALSNADQTFLRNALVETSGGRLEPVVDMPRHMWPIQETFIYSDMAQYSFFFEERYINPSSREDVKVYDNCWYMFSNGMSQADVDRIPAQYLLGMLGEGVSRTFLRDYAEQFKSDTDGGVVRMVPVMRRGMCGGIIYHADIGADGTRKPYGSWSTHT